MTKPKESADSHFLEGDNQRNLLEGDNGPYNLCTGYIKLQ